MADSSVICRSIKVPVSRVIWESKWSVYISQ